MKSSYLPGVVFALSIIGCSQQNPLLRTKTNQEASFVGNFPVNPLSGKVITSWIDKRNATMSTLYGNDLAVQYARSNVQHTYPAGSVLALVTWNQQEDGRWFGGKIPSTPKSVEFVIVGSAADHRLTYSYREYNGIPFKQISVQDGSTPNDRTAYLLSQRASVMP